MTLHETVCAELGRLLASGGADPRRLDAALRILCKWRSHVLQAELVRRFGVVVQGGPFRGMTYLAASSESCHIPKLLGCYEIELHPAIERAAARSYARVLNIGSAEGYYAIGLARRLPGARVGAFDADAVAQKACRSLAAMHVIVECHDCFNPAISAELARRFAPTHDIEKREQKARDVALPDLFDRLGELDRLLAVWEWRGGPTPWLVMRARQR